jgi:ureidoacrylate peracid hydrolase
MELVQHCRESHHGGDMQKNRSISRREMIVNTALGGVAAVALPSSAQGSLERSKSRVISIEARPSVFEFHVARTAVIVVDMQNDFGSEGGMFHRAGIDISMIKAAVDPTRKVIQAARAAGIRIVYLKMGFLPDLSDLGTANSVNRVRHIQWKVGTPVKSPDGRESRILIRDTWSTDILKELTPEKGDTVLYKTRFSGFYKTDLDAILRRWGVENLIVTGCTTSICVESTLRDAMFRDYRCLLPIDCTAEPIGYGLPRSNHDASLLAVEVCLGWVSNSSNVIKSLAS